MAWLNEHCAEAEAADFPEVLRGPWAKLRGYSATLALILAVVDDPDAAVVNKVPVLGTLTLIKEYFKPHLRRLYPRMLQKPQSAFDRCRRARHRALLGPGLRHRELRQKIGGRFKARLVRDVLEDITDAGQVRVDEETKEYLLDEPLEEKHEE